MSDKSSNLGAAIRGRSMVTRDYTRGVRFKAQERKADERVNLGMIQMISAGASIVQSGAGFAEELGENVKTHERLKTGAKRIWEDSPEGQSGVSFDESGFEEANWWDRRFSKPEESINLGGKEFSTSDVVNLGKLDAKTSELMGAFDPQTGDRKNLWDTFGQKLESSPLDLSNKDLDPIKYEHDAPNQVQSQVNVIADKTATNIIKDNATANSKNNQVANLNKSLDSFDPTEGESFREYNQRLRDAGENIKDYNYFDRYTELYEQ